MRCARTNGRSRRLRTAVDVPSPAIEFYGDAGVLGNSPRFARQQLIVGPVGVGLIHLDALGLGHAGDLSYEIGWLFGATPASASGTLRWRLELEIPV